MLRVNVTDEFLEVTLSARAAFSKRSWPFVTAMAVPWLLCAGQRSIRRMASMGGLRRSASAYYRFLSEGKWRPLVLFRCLFELIVRTFSIRKLTLVLDDTLCPKWGRQIYGTGSFFDHVRRPRPGFIWGHNWVVLAVVVSAGERACIALPFWIGLYRPRDRCAPGQFRTRHEMAAAALRIVRALFPGPIRLLADGAYANASLVGRIRDLDIELVSRLRSDAALREVTPRRKGKRSPGRRAKHGAAMAKLRSMAGSRRAFRRQRVSIYGKSVALLVREFEAYWPALKCVIKVVITRDPKRPRRVAYLVSTERTLDAVAVIESFAMRWTIEQLFSVAKTQMGLGSAEVRRERSVVRHAHLCIALITWTEVWAYRLHPRSWARPFAQKLAWLRAETVISTVFASGPRARGSRRNARNIGRLFTSATAA
ncbi:MAG TPA: transposase [Candidatus Krumholzibacteria bacterium]